MANAFFDPGREGFAIGEIDWDTDDIRVMLVRSTYSYDAADKFVADLGAVDNGRSAALSGKSGPTGCSITRSPARAASKARRPWVGRR